MTLTTIILLVLALYGVQIFLQETSGFSFNLKRIVGNRDTPPDLTVMAGRLNRAKNNMQEALPFFITLALLALITGKENNFVISGAMIFLLARLVYVPAYMSGIPWLRSIIWLAANAGLVMMAIACLQN